MRRPLVLAALVAVAGVATPALANPLPPTPVGVSRGADGSVCVTVSEQVPQCTPGLSAAR